MDGVTIFQHLTETRLLPALANNPSQLAIVGDPPTIEYLKQSALEATSHSFWVWPMSSTDPNFLAALTQSYAVVVASITDEQALYNQLKAQLKAQLIDSAPNLQHLRLVRLFADGLVNLLTQNKLLQPADTAFVPPRVSYAILTTPRSGSTFLCNLLQETNQAGFPAEHFRQPIRVLTHSCHFDFDRFSEILMTRCTTANQVFGTKFISHFLMQYREDIPAFDPFFQTYFQKVIFLTRRDQVAQAVSLYLAKRIGIWHIRSSEMQQAYTERLNQIKLEDCSLEEIRDLHRLLVRQEAYIKQFLKAMAIEPLLIEYEQLVQEKEAHLERICEFLAIHPTPSQPVTQDTIKTTRSGLTSQIIEKYKDQYAASYSAN